MACPDLGVRRRLLVGGVRSPGLKPKGSPFHPGGHGRGTTGRANSREPLVDASLSAIPVDGKVRRGAGTGRCEAADAGREVAPVRVRPAPRQRCAPPGVDREALCRVTSGALLLGRVGPASSVLRVRGMRDELLLRLWLPRIGAD
jgi:hypothetical protein